MHRKQLLFIRLLNFLKVALLKERKAIFGNETRLINIVKCQYSKFQTLKLPFISVDARLYSTSPGSSELTIDLDGDRESCLTLIGKPMKGLNLFVKTNDQTTRVEVTKTYYCYEFIRNSF
jgi:hypothetical protein